MQEEQMANKDVTNQMIEHAKKIVEQMRNMTEKYGADWLEKLPDFKGSFLLKEYQDNVCDIEKLSYNNNKMTHLLYHMMNQHSFDFLDMYNTSINNSGPNDLKESFKKSIEFAENLTNDSKSYAWYSNMKLPSTYAKNENVVEHYIKLSKIFLKKPLVKIRRIHLFYESMIEGKKDELSKLFTTLLVEYLMRIDSRIILIKDEKIDINDFYHFSNHVKNSKGYLLDFALYHNEMRNYDGVYQNNYISLFADFCFERKGVKENFENQRVYCINEYNIFHILRNYYISLWEKDNYVKYLKNFNFPNIQMKGIIDLYENGVDVINIMQLWKRYLSGVSVNEYFDDSLFKLMYSFDVYKIKHKIEYEEHKYRFNINKKKNNIDGDIFEIVRQTILNTLKNMTPENDDFDDHFEDFFLRDKLEDVESYLNELYNLHVKTEIDMQGVSKQIEGSKSIFIDAIEKFVLNIKNSHDKK